ncbi:MAG: ABC transporter permease subunit, partial [Halobacteria archaeon]|nr:ABC transporter permease subunit [Halobacteria archaeon]
MTRGVLNVARKDFEDAVRSKSLWALIVLFILFVGGGAYAIKFVHDMRRVPVEQPLTSDTFVTFFTTQGSLLSTSFIALIGLFTAYSAVIDERERGSLKILLSLPHSRADVMFGKIIGRSGVVTLAVVVSFVITTLEITLVYDSVSFTSLVGFMLLTAFLNVIYVSIGVGISAGL